jgi:type II restriction enzyme
LCIIDVAFQLYDHPTLQDVYAFTAQLQTLHPDNRHVPDKIRQQLQVLRDLGLVEFLGGGRYRSL